MTAFARKVLNELPAPTNAGAANNYQILQNFTNTTNKAGGKVNLQVNPTLSAVRPLRLARRRHLRRPEDPAAVRRRRQRVRPTPQQAARARHRPTRRRRVAARGALRLVDAPRAARTRRRSARPARSTRTASPACRPIRASRAAADAAHHRLLRPRPSGDEPAVAVPDGLQPEGQLHVAGGPPLAQERLRVPAHPDRSAGRQPALRPRRIRRPVLPAGRRRRRPTTTSTTSPTSCSALRRPYALSNILIANLAAEHALHLSAGRLARERPADAQPRPALRVRDAVGREGQHPVELRSRDADDGARAGRIARRTARRSSPIATTSARASAWPTRSTPATVLRGGYGISYVHFHRAGGANVLPINGPQVINAVVNQTPTQADFRPTQQGYPAGLTDPSRFNPLLANITYMPEDYHSSRVQSWFVSVQRELWDGALVDLAYIGNRADDLLLFANFNQAAPNNSAGTLPLQARRPIPEFGDITYSFNGGKSRYHAFQAKFDWRMARGFSILNSLTLSQTKDNGAGSLENPNGNFPAPQNFYNLEADFGARRVSPAVQQHDQLRVRPAVRHRPPLRERRRRRSPTRSSAAGRSPASTASTRASRSRSSTRRPRRSRCPASSRTSAAPTTTGRTSSATRWCRGPADGAELVQPRRVVIPTDPSQPFGNAPRNACAARWSGRSTWRCRSASPAVAATATSSSAPSSSTCSTARTSARRTATAAPPAFGTITPPTIRGSSSSG